MAALHVSDENVTHELKTVRLARTFLRQSVAWEGQRVVLFSPRGRQRSCYFGMAILGPVIDANFDDDRFSVLLIDVEFFATKVSLATIYSGEPMRPPFHSYSRSVRQVDEREAEWLQRHVGLVDGFSEAPEAPFDNLLQHRQDRARLTELRLEMLKYYGPACVFTGEQIPSLDGLRFGTHTGHLRPRRNGGLDLIWNAVPMTPNVNRYWDEGLIGLDNDRRILIALNADDEVRRSVTQGTLIRSPHDIIAQPNMEYVEWHRNNIFGKGPRFF